MKERRGLVSTFDIRGKWRVRGSNLLLFVASACKYLKKGDYCFVIVYKSDASYKFLDQIQLKPLKLFNT